MGNAKSTQTNDDGCYVENARCKLHHPRIHRVGPSRISLPLKTAGYSIDAEINNKMQYYRLQSDEFTMFAFENSVTGAFVADVKHSARFVKPVASTVRKDSIIHSAVPYFYHNVFTAMIGNSEAFATERFAPHQESQLMDMHRSVKKPVPPANELISSTGYGCFHIHLEKHESGENAIIDESKKYYVASQCGTNKASAIFQHFQCSWEFDDKTNTLYFHRRQIKNVEKHNTFPGGCVYFNQRTFVSPSLLKGANRKHRALQPVLNKILKTMSVYYTVNPHAIELYEGGKLLSPEEERKLHEIAAGSRNKQDIEFAYDMLDVFTRRVCSQLTYQWSERFAMEDGIVDTGGDIDSMTDLMLNYRKTARFGPKAFMNQEVFDKLETPQDKMNSLTFFVYDMKKIVNKTDDLGQQRFKFDVKGKDAFLLSDGAKRQTRFKAVIPHRRSKADGLVHTNGNETRITKFISATDLLQKVLIDGELCGFYLLSQHKRDPQTLEICSTDKVPLDQYGVAVYRKSAAYIIARKMDVNALDKEEDGLFPDSIAELQESLQFLTKDTQGTGQPFESSLPPSRLSGISV